jgi:quercetin dioxygenase-like cupin family protein
VGTAFATPPVDQTVIPVTQATLGTFDAQGAGIDVESEQRSADVAIAKVVLDPGGSTGWHHIPGVTLASVASGSVAVYDEKCKKSVYKAGEGFIEDRNISHVVRNQGNADAVLYTTLIAPTKLLKLPFEQVRMDDPKPKNCKVS